MSNLTNTQKAKAQMYTAMWQKEWIDAKEKGAVLSRVMEEGKKALGDLATLKANYLKTKDPAILGEFTSAYGKVVAATAVLYTKESTMEVGNLNGALKTFSTEKLGLKESDLSAFMRQLAGGIRSRNSIEELEKQEYMPDPEADFQEMANQLSVPLPQVQKEEPVAEEPKKEEAKKKEAKPEPEPQKEEPKKITWREQTNLPDVKGTMPAVIVEGALKLVKPEDPADKIPFVSAEDAIANAKRALDDAMAARTDFQATLSKESRDAFYANMSKALLHYSRSAGKMDTATNYENGKIQNRLMNDFGFSQNDLRRAATAIFGSEHGVLRAWAPGEEEKLEDRALKIGAPDLTSTKPVEKVAQEPKAEEKTVDAPKAEEIREPVEEIKIENGEKEPERQRISVDLYQPTSPARGMEPAKPSITAAQIQSMLKWKQALANQPETAVMQEYLRMSSDFQSETKTTGARDNAIGKMFAMGNYFEKTQAAYLVGNVKKILFDNTSISESEIDVGMTSLEANPNGIEQDLKDLKAREFDEQFKVPDAVKNFAHAKEMIDVNNSFFRNGYGLEKQNFTEFARKHYEALQNNVKNPPLAEEGDPKKALYDASIGMYPRVRAAYEKRGFFDFIRHPIDSFRERALMNNLKNTLQEGGMTEANVESLYTEANTVFGLDKLDYQQSLNGKTNPAEINDKLIDPREAAPVTGEKQPAKTDLTSSLDREMQKFQGLEQKAENKEIRQPEIKAPHVDAPHQ